MQFIGAGKKPVSMIAACPAWIFREITKHVHSRRTINCTVTSAVIPMVSATTHAYTAQQPIAVAMERVEQVGRRQVGLNWRKTK